MDVVNAAHVLVDRGDRRAAEAETQAAEQPSSRANRPLACGKHQLHGPKKMPTQNRPRTTVTASIILRTLT
jgi:hypothetical protein